VSERDDEFKYCGRTMSIFTKIWKKFLHVLAIVPILATASIFSVAVPSYLFSLIFTRDTTLYILEIIICLLLTGFYFKFLTKCNYSKFSFFPYFLISILTLIIFFISKYKLVIIFQFALILTYAIVYINRFQRFRCFLSKSIEVLAFMNIYDGIFSGIFIYFLYHLDLVNSVLNDLMKSYKINGNQMSDWISILLILIVPVILAIIKALVSIKIFKQKNDICVPKGRTLWNAYASMILSSFVWYIIYLYYFFSRTIDFHSDLIVDIVVLNSYMALYLICWRIVYNQIWHGIKEVKDVIASWVTGIVCLLLLALFNQVESELINALTWFLPILIPSLIGEINSQFDPKKYKKKPIRTDKMDRHLYKIQLYSFLTLLMLSIIPKLIEIITGLKIKVELANLLNFPDNWMSGFYASTIIVLFCFILSLIFGSGMIWLLKYFYLEPSKSYYKFEKNKRKF
jgi:putative membrane protein